MWDITYTSLLTHPLFFRYPSHPSVEEALTPLPPPVLDHQPQPIESAMNTNCIENWQICLDCPDNWTK